MDDNCECSTIKELRETLGKLVNEAFVMYLKHKAEVERLNRLLLNERNHVAELQSMLDKDWYIQALDAKAQIITLRKELDELQYKLTYKEKVCDEVGTVLDDERKSHQRSQQAYRLLRSTNVPTPHTIHIRKCLDFGEGWFLCDKDGIVEFDHEWFSMTDKEIPYFQRVMRQLGVVAKRWEPAPRNKHRWLFWSMHDTTLEDIKGQDYFDEDDEGDYLTAVPEFGVRKLTNAERPMSFVDTSQAPYATYYNGKRILNTRCTNPADCIQSVITLLEQGKTLADLPLSIPWNS